MKEKKIKIKQIEIKTEKTKSIENKLKGLICKFRGPDANFQEEKKKKKACLLRTKSPLTTRAI